MFVFFRTVCRLFGAFLIGFCHCAALYAASPTDTQGPYCGISALYAASRAMGSKQGTFEGLLDSKYVSTMNGSTVSDLIAAARVLGVEAEHIPNSGVSTLLLADNPLILHTSTPDDRRKYTHWMLFLGIENGSAKVLGSNGQQRNVAMADLLTQWDGDAILVRQAPNVGAVWLLRFAQFAIAVVVVIACDSVCRLYVRSAQRLGWLLPEPGCRAVALSACVTTLILALGVSTANCILGATSSDAFAKLSVGLQSDEIRTVNTQFLRDVAQGKLKQHVLVDVRYQADFDNGTIPGAVSLPVNLPFEAYEQFAQQYANVPLVLFCHSAQCEFDKRAAKRLLALGCKNVVCVESGYVEFRDADAEQ